jgi:hypothetical protein
LSTDLSLLLSSQEDISDLSSQVLKLEAEIELLKKRMVLAPVLGWEYDGPSSPSASAPLPSLSKNAVSGNKQLAKGKNTILNQLVCC